MIHTQCRLQYLGTIMTSFICFLLLQQTVAQDKTGYFQSASNRVRSIDVLRELLLFPNDAQFPEDIDKNITWLKQAFEKRGFIITLLPSKAKPFVFAQKGNDPAKPTVLYYLHFDGQPVSKKNWQQEDPFKPVLKAKKDNNWTVIDWKSLDNSYDPEWRIYARSSSDDKGPIAMLLVAMDWMQHDKQSQAYNIKVILDSEEEKGSPNLTDVVKENRSLLMADRLVILDGPQHTSNEPTLVFGCRGVSQLDLEMFGPRNDLHSGHYGNYAPNPAFELSSLLVSMKDTNGKILVPGFYDNIHLTDKVKELLLAVPDKKDHINQLIGIAKEDDPSQTYQQVLQYPSLNILNFTSGQPEAGTRNIVPASAKAQLDIRLVPESDPVLLEASLRKFIQGKGFYIIDNRKPTEEERKAHSKIISFKYGVSSLAFVTEPESNTGEWLMKCIGDVYSKKPVVIRMAGGTVPIATFIKELNIPAVLLPTVNPDNNQHASDENLRLGNYFDGIIILRKILSTAF